ncbi:MAG: adenylosuccinate synthase [Thermomicrobiales bacterium]
MPATIILGGLWGDEGKGKLTDALSSSATMVVRANGGSNAGHTVVAPQGKFKFRLMPSGILNPNCICVLGAGVAIELPTLIAEMDDLLSRGIDVSNLRISDRAHLVLPWHRALDQLEETRREQDEIGTTLNGNGPTYADKASRHGIRVADILRPEILRRKLAIELDSKNQLLASVYGAEGYEFESLYRDLTGWADRIRSHVIASEVVVQDELAKGANILIECAQGAMLDIDYGTYPYVTSSSPTAAGACQGAGVAPTQIDRVIGVYKAYTTRVGGGPMPSELTDDVGELIRARGNEYGTVTGRPRRTGWFDAVAARQSARLNGVTDLNIALVDVLDVFETVSMCTGYQFPDRVMNHVPALLDDLEGAAPIWEEYAGWNSDTTNIESWEDLPAEVHSYLAGIEQKLDTRVTYVGVGPAREQLIQRS